MSYIVVSQHDILGNRYISKPGVLVVKSKNDLVFDPRSVDVGFHSLNDIIDNCIPWKFVDENYKTKTGEVKIQLSENEMTVKIAEENYDTTG